MRKELFWEMDIKKVPALTEIERAINFGGFDYIKKVQKKYGMQMFIKTLTTSRNLSRKAVSYWCLILKINRKKTKIFKQKMLVWLPQR